MEPQSIPCPIGMTGTSFLDATKSMDRAAREDAIYDAIADGVVPAFAARFADNAMVFQELATRVPVALDATNAPGRLAASV